ncbi:MAG: flagellar biosynthetic protein FliR [Acidimicrobiales bacterium]
MNFQFDPTTAISFLLVMTRLVTVLSVAPPFNGSMIPPRVRVAIAASLGLLIAPLQPVDISLEVFSLLVAIGYQVVVGAMFGYLIQLMLSVPMIAGSMIDGLSGLSASTLFDPTSNSSATPAARLNQMLAMIVLVGIEGHLLIVRGVMRSYEAAPLSGFRIEPLGQLLVTASGQLLLAAVEIALPVLVALLMTEAVLALSARAAPRLNVMVLGFAVKSIVFMLLFALSLPLLINAVANLLDRSLRWAMAVVGG